MNNYNARLNNQIQEGIATLRELGVLSQDSSTEFIQISLTKSIRTRQRYNANINRAINENLRIQNVPFNVFQTNDRTVNGQRVPSALSTLITQNVRLERVAYRVGDAGFHLSAELARLFSKNLEYNNGRNTRSTLISDLENVNLATLREFTTLRRPRGQTERVRIITRNALRQALNTKIWRQVNYFVVNGVSEQPDKKSGTTLFQRITGHQLPRYNTDLQGEERENDYYQQWLDLYNAGVLSQDYNLRGGKTFVEFHETHVQIDPTGRFNNVDTTDNTEVLRAIRDQLADDEVDSGFNELMYDLFIVYSTERYLERTARGHTPAGNYVLRRSDEEMRIYVTLFGATYTKPLVDNGCVPTAMSKCFQNGERDADHQSIKKIQKIRDDFNCLFQKDFQLGITIGQLKRFLGTGKYQQDLSCYLFDQYGNCIVNYTSSTGGKTGRYRKALIGWVHNNHLYTVTDNQMRNIMKERALSGNTGRALKVTLKNAEPVKQVEIVSTPAELRKIIKESQEVPILYGKSLRNWNTAVFSDRTIKVITDKEHTMVSELITALGEQYGGQKFVNGIAMLLEKNSISFDHFASSFNADTLQIYNQDNRSLYTSYGLCKVFEAFTEDDLAVDMVKSYSRTMMYYIKELPVFDMSERIIHDYDTQVFDHKSLYYVETSPYDEVSIENAWAIRGNGWYWGSLLEHTPREVFKTIYRVTPNRWVSAEPFQNLFKWCYDNLSEKTAKNVCNSIVGMFGQTKKPKTIEIHMSQSKNDISSGQSYDKFDDLHMYSTPQDTETKTDHCVPINTYIVQMAHERLWKLSQTLQNAGNTILAIKTDCIVYRGNRIEDTEDYKGCSIPEFHAENKTVWRSSYLKYTETPQQKVINEYIAREFYKADSVSTLFDTFVDTSKGCMVTGGGGSGKSYLMTNSHLFWGPMQDDTLLMAPSWVATLNIADRVHNCNHMTAQMGLLHRSLDYLGKRYKRIVIDEFSMVSPAMLKNLAYIKRKYNTAIYMFGDLSQLLHVGVSTWRWDTLLAELCPYHIKLNGFKRGDTQVKHIADKLRTDNLQTSSQEIMSIMKNFKGNHKGFAESKSAISVRHIEKNAWNTKCAKYYSQNYTGVWISSCKKKVVHAIPESDLTEEVNLVGSKVIPDIPKSPQEAFFSVVPTLDNIEPAFVDTVDEYWSVPFYIFEGVELIAYNSVSTKDCKFYNSQILRVESINEKDQCFTASIKGITGKLTVSFKTASENLQYAPRFGCVTIYKSQGLTFDYKYSIIGSRFMEQWLSSQHTETYRRYCYVALTRATAIENINYE